MKTLDQMIGNLSPERREKITERTKQLITPKTSFVAKTPYQLQTYRQRKTRILSLYKSFSREDETLYSNLVMKVLRMELDGTDPDLILRTIVQQLLNDM